MAHLRGRFPGRVEASLAALTLEARDRSVNSGLESRWSPDEALLDDAADAAPAAAAEPEPGPAPPPASAPSSAASNSHEPNRWRMLLQRARCGAGADAFDAAVAAAAALAADRSPNDQSEGRTTTAGHRG